MPHSSHLYLLISEDINISYLYYNLCLHKDILNVLGIRIANYITKIMIKRLALQKAWRQRATYKGYFEKAKQ